MGPPDDTIKYHRETKKLLLQKSELERTPPRLDTFMTNTVFELPVIEAMGGDIVLLASPRMCAADLRGDISGQWKEQQLWGRTFSVPVREQFHVREDGATIWDSAGGAVCPPGTFFFDHPGYTDLMADFDSCGSVSSILGDLAECGVQVFNPVQISAENMAPASLKERFGRDIVFWGGVYDAQLIPADASYEEVYAAVSKNISILGKNGGFIFSGVHNLPAAVSDIHLREMMDALRDNGRYSL